MVGGVAGPADAANERAQRSVPPCSHRRVLRSQRQRLEHGTHDHRSSQAVSCCTSLGATPATARRSEPQASQQSPVSRSRRTMPSVRHWRLCWWCIQSSCSPRWQEQSAPSSSRANAVMGRGSKPPRRPTRFPQPKSLMPGQPSDLRVTSLRLTQCKQIWGGRLNSRSRYGSPGENVRTLRTAPSGMTHLVHGRLPTQGGRVADEVHRSVHVTDDRRARLEVDLDGLPAFARTRAVHLDVVVAKSHRRPCYGRLPSRAAPRPVQRLVFGERDVETRVTDDPALLADHSSETTYAVYRLFGLTTDPAEATYRPAGRM